MTRTAGGVEYELTRKTVKNLNLRVRADGTVHVSAPRRTPLSEVDGVWSRAARRGSRGRGTPGGCMRGKPRRRGRRTPTRNVSRRSRR